MNKRRIKIAIKVLGEVKIQFPETVEFINDRLEQECQKENMSVDEVIFFTSLDKKIFFVWIWFNKSL